MDCASGDLVLDEQNIYLSLFVACRWSGSICLCIFCFGTVSEESPTSQLCEENWKQAARPILQLIDVLAALVIQNNGKLRSAASDRRSSRDDELRMHCCFNPAGAACAS